MIEAFTVLVSSDMNKVEVELNGDLFLLVPEDQRKDLLKAICNTVLVQVDGVPIKETD